MATSRRHWTEQYLQLDRNEARFFRSSDSKRVIQRISINSIIAVRPLRTEELPFEGFGFFQIETFARIYYFMVRSDYIVNEWLKAFGIIKSSVLNFSGEPLAKSALSTANNSARWTLWNRDGSKMDRYRSKDRFDGFLSG
jgi:hypothetical protein